MKRTPLYDFHAAHGRVVEFAGYEMPIWYSSIMEEHMAVRNHAGIFDVSHMGRVVVGGADATRFIERSCRQAARRNRWEVILHAAAQSDGGIIDDIIIIKRPDDYLMVVNAANRAKDLEHIRNVSGPLAVEIDDITDDTTMIAIQGPEANLALQPLSAVELSEMKRFTHTRSKVGGSDATITRTGYTGEDGFEIILHDSGIKDNSLAALCGATLRPGRRPAASARGTRSGWRRVCLCTARTSTRRPTHRGRAVLGRLEGEDGLRRGRGRGTVQDDATPEVQEGHNDGREDSASRLHDNGLSNRQIGEVTSGTFSPLLRKGIGIGYIDTPDSQVGAAVQVVVRDSPSQGKIVKPPFYDETVYGWKRTR